MRRTTVRRTVLAASAVSLALLVTACGSDEPAAKDKPKAEASKSAPAAAPAAKALSQAEVDKLMLTQSDLPRHKINPATKADFAAAKAASADRKECAPLVDGMALRGTGDAAASSVRKVIAIPENPGKDATEEEKLAAAMETLSGTITADTVASYEGQGAADTLAAIKKAGTDCGSGFTMLVGTDKLKFTKVAPAAYPAGDEAVNFALTVDMEGKPGNAYLTAVRKGGTVATFYALSLAGKSELPKAVIDAQVKKLG
ncbi:hypothetical protein [Streptomyces albipurpureus]|uniref:Lipoprotein n=1 Tax=Streptomyces albipurpureus TaxID=2897419 RepID=A0ABT0UQ12_9ACTN|nr:hypothetical protein [Streptomyces sp. CWNU-1]MCM2390709.1 hypothetical protein [Streptomyces sp. CWNU-1]